MKEIHEVNTDITVTGIGGTSFASDVSLFKDNIKIQPDGSVNVKIKIQQNLITHTGFDVVHIADYGKVTPMNGTVEEEIGKVK